MLIDTPHAGTPPRLDTDAIRRSLEQERIEREDITRELSTDAPPAVDPVAWATMNSARRVLSQVSAALDRLEAGTYGRCVRCSGAIAPARLEALPYADSCIECQSRIDRS